MKLKLVLIFNGATVHYGSLNKYNSFLKINNRYESKYVIFTSLAVVVSPKWKKYNAQHPEENISKFPYFETKTPKLVEQDPKIDEPTRPMTTPTTIKTLKVLNSYDYDDEEYVYYDEWTPLDAGEYLRK